MTASGTDFSVTDTAGSTYLIYGLSFITLTADYDSSIIVASNQFTGILRLVLLNQTSDKALLDEYSQVYPTSVDLDYSFTDTTGTLIFNWNTVGDGSELLLLTWPHHRFSLQNPKYPAPTALSYLTTKVLVPLLLLTLFDKGANRDGCIPCLVMSGNCSTTFPPLPGIHHARLTLLANQLSFKVFNTKLGCLLLLMYQSRVTFTTGVAR